MYNLIKKRQAFTLIELLVVISIIALLISILMPVLGQARASAYKAICQSNEHQIGVAIAMYGTDFDYDLKKCKSAVGLTNAELEKHWFWRNGTADYAHEAQPNVVRDLMNNEVLESYEVFFCPSVKKLSYDLNFAVNEVDIGLYKPRDTASIYKDIAAGELPAMSMSGYNRPLFWSTHIWLWKKEIRNDVVSVNPVSQDALMCDMTYFSWEFARTTNTTLEKFFASAGIMRGYQHNNVLMKDMSVANPSDEDDVIVQWLWNSDTWAGTGFVY
ncbi:MAG: prepilin-type N-terminal cleavage/methylation domain-containing protein [Sedimentisphaerales bacterium]|nr:prepilin-type N-terminal cleavage/methylation domain-containing protein [Sedimentisphaerales bacterium]